MSDRLAEIQSEARLSWRFIPSGRQLPRTPPLASVKKQLDFCTEDSGQEHEEHEEHEELQQAAETDGIHQEDDARNTTLDFNTLGIKSEPDDPSAMLRGMTGYQLTQTDSEFMEKMRVEKLVKKLKGDLEELQRSSIKENTLLKLASVSRKEALAGLQTLPSGEDLTEWVKVILTITSPYTDVTDLDAKSLLAMVTERDIERAVAVKRMLIRVKKRVAHAKLITQSVNGQLEQLVAVGQLEIQGLMRELSHLKSELAQLEERYKALKVQLIGQEAPAEDAAASEELKAAKRPATSNTQESVRGRRKPPQGNPRGAAPPQGNPRGAAAPPQGNPRGAAAPPQGNPQGAAAPPQGNPQGAAAPPQGNPQGAAAPPQGNPQGAAAPPQGNPRGAAPPQGNPRGAAPPPQGNPRGAAPPPQGNPRGAAPPPQGNPRGAAPPPQGNPRGAAPPPQGNPRGAAPPPQGNPRGAAPPPRGAPPPPPQGNPRGAAPPPRGAPPPPPQGNPRGAAPPQGNPRGAAPPQGNPRGAAPPPRGAAPPPPQGNPRGAADAGVALSSSLQGRKRAAEEEAAAQPAVLRRSKRIASRR